MKKLTLVVSLVGLVAAAGLAWWVQNRGGSQAQAAVAPGGPQADAARAGGGRTGAGPGGGQGAAPGGAPGASGQPGGGGAGRGPGGPGGGQGGPAPVEIGRVEALRLEDDAQAVGSLRSKQGVVLRPEVSGRIVALNFNDGQRVRRGALLIQLDDALQKAQLAQAQAQSSIAKTNLQRQRDLVAQGFISQSAVDQSAAALEVSEAQVVLAQAQLARMKVLAPFDGIVGIRSANVGDYVKDGADIVALEDLSSLWVDFRLPERYLSRLKVGQAAQLQIDAMPGRAFSARVEALDAQLDANGRSVLVRARLGNPTAELRGGMFARVRLVFKVTEQALLVPEEALVPQGAKQFVFKVVDGPQGGKVSQRVEAKIGQRIPGKVELLDGVAAGDAVVVAGHGRLLRGDAVPVRPIDLSAPQRAGGGGGPGAAGGPRAGRPPGASGAASGAGRAASGPRG